MFDVTTFVGNCRSVCGAENASAGVLELMRAAVADPAAIASALKEHVWAGPDPVGVLLRSDDLTIVAVDLQPGEISVPHDHRMWAVIGIYQGSERNRFFERAPGGLQLTGERTVLPGETLRLDPDVVHAIANPENRVSRGLHVYGGDLFAAHRSMWSAEIGEEHGFEFAAFEAWNEELRRAQPASPAASASDHPAGLTLLK